MNLGQAWTVVDGVHKRLDDLGCRVVSALAFEMNRAPPIMAQKATTTTRAEHIRPFHGYEREGKTEP